MSIPKLPSPNYKPDPISIKAYSVLWRLRNMNYDVYDEREAVDVIEKKQLDHSLFDFPYGSFEEFKKHTLTGEFDFDMEKAMSENVMTDELRKEIENQVRNHEAWITY